MSAPTYMDMEDAVREMDGSDLTGSAKRTINAMRQELIRSADEATYAVRLLEHWTGRRGEMWKLRDLADEAAKRIKRQQDSIEALNGLVGEHRDIAAGLERRLGKVRNVCASATHDCSLRADILSLTMGFEKCQPFGYGIVDKDGAPWWSEDCVCQDRETLQGEVLPGLNEELYSDDPRRPYRVVRLVAEEVEP